MALYSNLSNLDDEDSNDFEIDDQPDDGQTEEHFVTV